MLTPYCFWEDTGRGTVDIRSFAAVMRRFWPILVCAPVLCAVLAGLAYTGGVISRTYTATASLSAIDPSSTVSQANMSAILNSFAQSAPEEVDGSSGKLSVAYGSGLTAQTLLFEAESNDPETSVALANEAAFATCDSLKAYFQNLIEQTNDYDPSEGLIDSDINPDILNYRALLNRKPTFEFCRINVTPAENAQSSGWGLSKIVLVALGGGLVGTAGVLCLIDMVKRPIKSRRDLDGLDVPVLAVGDNEASAERVWANVTARYGVSPSSVCLVSVKGQKPCALAEGLASVVGKTVERVFDTDAPAMPAVDVRACASFQDSADTILVSRYADVTVLVVRPWENTRADVDAALREAATAKANIAGIVLV